MSASLFEGSRNRPCFPEYTREGGSMFHRVLSSKTHIRSIYRKTCTDRPKLHYNLSTWPQLGLRMYRHKILGAEELRYACRTSRRLDKPQTSPNRVDFLVRVGQNHPRSPKVYTQTIGFDHHPRTETTIGDDYPHSSRRTLLTHHPMYMR